MKDKKNLFSLIIFTLACAKDLKKKQLQYTMNHYLTSFVNLIHLFVKLCAYIINKLSFTLKLHKHSIYI